MALIVHDVLEQVSRALVESCLVSAFPAPVALGSQVVAAVDPAIYVGAQLIAGYRTPNQEIVTVTAITNANFTATYANTHAALDPLVAATFPSGQIIQDLAGAISPAATVAPLFTQAEMLGYFKDAQNDFLESTRMIYAIAGQALTANLAIYPTPADSIRVERISIGGTALWNVSQAELDMNNANWQSETGGPTQWYQDKLGTGKFAVAPPPPVGLAAKLWYSQKGTTLPLLTDSLLVPDVFWPYLKYGVLGKAWSKDGETKDPRRAAYCAKRYLRGVQYGVMFARGMQAVMKAQAGA